MTFCRSTSNTSLDRFEKRAPKMYSLELGRVHLPAQDVGRSG